MCGICGIFRVDAGPVDLTRVQRMRDAMDFRGPDASGISSGPGYALGHRRLSIIDLSPHGTQPMANEDGSVEIVFNGEIYNFQELRQELKQHHCFNSATDSEVLLHGFEEWGLARLLQRIRGMFAFAIVDHRSREIHLARDPLGKKPLFFHLGNRELVFASSASALVLGLQQFPEVDPAAVYHLLWDMYIPCPRSIFRGVEKLRPGNALSIGRDGRRREFVHWKPEFLDPDDGPSEKEWLERIEAALQKAVARRLVADVPIGVLLSGGVDSSLVAGIASATVPHVRSFSVRTEDPALDESNYAAKVAERCGTEHHLLHVQAECCSNLPLLVQSMGEPLADASALNVIAIASEARRYVKVVLTGDGGDEAFGGYQHYFAYFVADHLRRACCGQLQRPLGMLSRALRAYPGPLSRAATLFRLASAPLEETFFCDSLMMNEVTRKALYTPEFQRCVRHDRINEQYLAALTSDDIRINYVDRAMQAQMQTILADDYLAKVDSGTMAVGLEARCPLLDLEVLEVATRIPARYRFSNYQPKSLLRKLALKYVPRTCIQRRKRGFVAPVGRWLRFGWRDMLEEVVLGRSLAERGWFERSALQRLVREHRAGVDHGYALWGLVILELWLQNAVRTWTAKTQPSEPSDVMSTTSTPSSD